MLGGCGCRRTQVAGPLTLERRRLHALLLSVQDLATCLDRDPSAARPGPLPEPPDGSNAADELRGLEARLQLDSFSFLVQMRAAIRRRLAELKQELSQS